MPDEERRGGVLVTASGATDPSQAPPPMAIMRSASRPGNALVPQLGAWDWTPAGALRYLYSEYKTSLRSRTLQHTTDEEAEDYICGPGHPIR